MEQQLAELNQKIDALTTQVAYLAEQAQLAERARQERDELVETMMPVAKDAMRLATRELEDIQEYLEPADLIRLLKKIASHRPQIEMLIDQLDSLTDLMEIVGPVTKEGMNWATVALDGLDRKGYFGLARGGLRMVDNVATSFNEDDVNRLGDNIVLILNTIKDMTQPEIMNFVHNTFLRASHEVEKPVDTSLVAIMRQMQDPAVRRGLALTLRVLRVIGEQADSSGKR